MGYPTGTGDGRQECKLMAKFGSNGLNQVENGLHSNQKYELDEADKKMLPCASFLTGYCPKGYQCIFYHPTPDNMETVITSPPFPEGFGSSDALKFDLSRRVPCEQVFTYRRRSRPNRRQNLVPSEENICLSEMRNFEEEIELEADRHEPQTLFQHIDWQDFLAPGQGPPPLVNVPKSETPPRRKVGRNLLNLMREPQNSESSKREENGSGDTLESTTNPVKEEMKLKFKLIAAELASGKEDN